MKFIKAVFFMVILITAVAAFTLPQISENKITKINDSNYMWYTKDGSIITMQIVNDSTAVYRHWIKDRENTSNTFNKSKFLKRLK